MSAPVLSVGLVEQARKLIAAYDEAVVEYVQTGNGDVEQAARSLVRVTRAATNILRELVAEADRAAPTKPTRRSPAELSDRELQVLRRMSQGKSNGQIGRELYLSEDTVKTHARRLFRKLDARDRAHAVAIAYQRGLLGVSA